MTTIEPAAPTTNPNDETSAPKKRGLPPLALISLTVLIDMIGFGIVIPILPLYAVKFGALDWQSGLLLGGYSAMQLIFAPILGKLSDRIGRRPVLLMSILGTALGFVVLGVANSLALLFIGRLIDGISGANIPTAQAYIADVTPAEKRSGAMGLIGACLGLGFMLGPALGGFLGHRYGIHTPFLAAAALALLNALGVFLFLPESLPVEKRGLQPERPSPWQTFLAARGTPLGTVMLCSLAVTAAFAGVTALFTLFTARRFNWTAQDNGWLFAYVGFLGLLIQGGMLRQLIKRVPEKSLIIVGTVCLVIAMAMLPVSTGLPMLLIASTFLATGNSLVTPLLSGWASRTADAQSQGVVLGLMQSIASLGRMIGPAIGGVLLGIELQKNPEHYGYTAFWAAAAVALLAVVLATRLRPADHAVHLPEAAAST